MFETIAMFAVCAVVIAVVQVEVYAMLHAWTYARKIDGSMTHKFRVWNARYDWSSVIFHEAGTVRPAYSVLVTLAVGLFGFIATLYGMHSSGVPMQVQTPLMGGLMAAAGFFYGAYGKAFAGHREYISIQQRLGTWDVA